VRLVFGAPRGTLPGKISNFSAPAMDGRFRTCFRRKVAKQKISGMEIFERSCREMFREAASSVY
jgi:hypothetical protein